MNIVIERHEKPINIFLKGSTKSLYKIIKVNDVTVAVKEKVKIVLYNIKAGLVNKNV
jgi:hypothetical protein